MAGPISIAYLEIRLSGGSGNTDPNASLGGVMSSERVLAQSAAAPTNITGVAINFAAGNALGNGTLTFTKATNRLQWTPFGGTIGTAVDISADGRYTIKGGGSNPGFVLVTVTFASLPGANQTDTNITIANIANELFDDVSKAESFAGDNEYRCAYLYNAHPTDSFLDAIMYIPTQATPGTLAFAKDLAGNGNGTPVTITGEVTRSGSIASVAHTAHGLTTGQYILVAGADQTEYNGTFQVTVDNANLYHYTVTGTPATPATGTITFSRGIAVTVANESTAPSPALTYSTGATEGAGVSLGALAPGDRTAFWYKRTIAAHNTTSNAAAISQSAFQAYY